MKFPEELRPAPGRVPPHDLDAEGTVLSALSLVPDDLDTVVGIIDWTMFYSESNKLIFRAMTELSAAGQPIDSVTLASYMRNSGTLDRAGGTPYLTQLSFIPFIANIVPHAQIIKDKWQARQLIIECHTYAAEAYADRGGSIELIQRAEQSLGELVSRGVTTELVHISEPLNSEIRLRQELRESGVVGGGTGTSTGYQKLDEMTGGLYDSDLIVVAGRPGMGKTSFVMNVIANLARPRPNDDTPRDATAFFSLEMPTSQLALRFACAEAGISFSKARKNFLNDDEWSKLIQAAEELSRAPIWIDDTPAISLLDVRARCRKLQRDIANGKAAVPCSRLKLVVLDYLQLATGVRADQDSREREVSSLSSGMKNLGKDLGVTPIAVSQLNRVVERRTGDKRPELSDLRESGAIEQDADGVWFVYREEYYDKEASPGEAEVIVKKQRNGATGTVYFTFEAESMRFYERAPKQYEDLAKEFAEDR